MGLTALLIAPLLMAAAGAPVPAKFTLPNGLQVELYEEHGHPFARAQMVYRAGGKDDPIGRAGLAHLVEHLMFQGTRHLRSGDVHRLFTAAGADQVRGYTTEDETGYFVRLPAASVELACWVFSSQMGFFLDQPDAARVLERERQVVLEELAGSEDAPETGLRARVAMRLLHGPGHPYARLTGGNRAELARVTPEDVRRFFLRHYRPDNATLTLGAPLPAAQLRALVEKYFGPLPRRAAPPAAAVPVVPAGVRRATIEAPVSLPALSMVWSAPPGRDLWALAAILDRRLTSKLGALPHPTYEPRALGGLLQLEMQLDSRIARVPPGKVEPAIDEVLAKLAREPVTAEELNHARTMTGLDSGVEAALTAEMVREQARALVGRPRVIIETVPQPSAPRGGRLRGAALTVDADRPDAPLAAGPLAPDAEFRNRVPEPAAAGTAPALIQDLRPLPGGLTVRYVKGSAPDDLSLDLLVRIPEERWTPARRAAARLLVRVLFDWQRFPRDRQAFLQPLELPGAIGGRLTGTVKDVLEVLPAFATALAEAKMDQAALDSARFLATSELRRLLGDPRAAHGQLIGAHALGEPPETAADLKALESVGLADLRALHRELFRPGNVLLAATTDMKPAALQAALVRAFVRWRVAPPGKQAAAHVAAAAATPARLTIVDRQDSSRATVVVTFPFPEATAPDHPAAAVAAEALAGGLDSRIGRLRTRSGWLYAFAHWQFGTATRSYLAVYAEVSPPRVAELLGAIERETRDLATTALPPEELRALRTGRARAFETSLAWQWGARDLASESWGTGISLMTWARFPARLRQVEEAAVRAAARTYLDPARARITVIAPRAQTALPAGAAPEHYSWSAERGVWR